jgi:hypothetical protein
VSKTEGDFSFSVFFLCTLLVYTDPSQEKPKERDSTQAHSSLRSKRKATKEKPTKVIGNHTTDMK